MYAVAIFMFTCMAAVAALIPSRRIRARSLAPIALVTAFINPDLRPWQVADVSHFIVPIDLIPTYILGFVPYGFPFGVVGAWALVAALRAARSNSRKAVAYGMVPIAIIAAYCAGYPLADRLATVTIPRMVRPGVPLPKVYPEVMVFELDGGSAAYAVERFAVRDDGRIGIARTTELVRRRSGTGCMAASRVIADSWYDIYIDCME